MSEKTLKEIAEFVEAEFVGNPEEKIHGVNGIFEAQKGEITFLANPKYRDKLPFCQASAILVGLDVDVPGLNLIKTRQPRLAYAKIMGLFYPPKQESKVIHPKAFISETAKIGEEVTIYAGAYIGHHTKIGDHSTIYPGVYIGDHVEIGEDCFIQANSSIHDKSKIGNHVLINSNSVIGGQGYGFEQDGDIHVKVPQLGNVVLEDDVEVGTLCAIDCGTINPTVIGKGTKIDNFVHIAHNCQIGPNNLFMAQANVAGTVKTGTNVYFGGRAGCLNHITIAGRTIIGPGGVATENIKESGDQPLYGYPARPFKEWSKASLLFYKTDEQRKKMMAMEKRLQELEAKLGGADSSE